MVLSLLISFSACFKGIMLSTYPIFWSFFLQSQAAAAFAREQGCLVLNPGSPLPEVLLLEKLCFFSALRIRAATVGLSRELINN